MKYLICLAIIINIGFSQTKGEYSDLVSSVRIIEAGSQSTYINKDLNADGKIEILSGEKIVKVGEDEYWVRNTTMTTENGDIYTFSNKLKKNDDPVIRQINSEFGYILQFQPGESVTYVYIADETGNKNSDAIALKLQ